MSSSGDITTKTGKRKSLSLERLLSKKIRLLSEDRHSRVLTLV
jgi:hypothetical protein